MRKGENRRLLVGGGRVGLAIDLKWIGDRYAHEIVLLADGAEHILAQSVEQPLSGAPSKGNETYEASFTEERPTFQELSLENHGGADIAFLVGMSGKAYWSASMEGATNSADNGSLQCTVDICCKGSSAAQLVSDYALPPGAEMDACGRVCLGETLAWRCTLEALSDAGMECELKHAEGRLLIASHLGDVRPTARRRWRYRIALQPSENDGKN